MALLFFFLKHQSEAPRPSSKLRNILYMDSLLKPRPEAKESSKSLKTSSGGPSSSVSSKGASRALTRVQSSVPKVTMALTANPDPVQKNPATGSSRWFLIVVGLLLRILSVSAGVAIYFYWQRLLTNRPSISWNRWLQP